jgi:hypothetical protein
MNKLQKFLINNEKTVKYSLITIGIALILLGLFIDFSRLKEIGDSFSRDGDCEPCKVFGDLYYVLIIVGALFVIIGSSYKTCVINFNKNVISKVKKFHKIYKNKSILLILISLSIVLTYLHFITIDQPRVLDRIELHKDIISNGAPAPYAYRVFLPFLAEFVIQIATLVMHYNSAFLYTYVFARFIITLLTFVIFFGYLQIFFEKKCALLGSVLLAFSHVLAYRDYFFQPTSMLELLVFVIGFWLIYTNRFCPLIILVTIGTLNRETTLVLALSYFLSHYRQNLRIAIRKSLVLALIWFAVYAGIRILRGPHPIITTYYQDIVHNISDVTPLICLILVYGIFWYFAFQFWRQNIGKKLDYKKQFIFVNLWWVPAFVLLHFFVGWVNEVRLFLPLAPIIIPASLYVIFDNSFNR